MAGDRCPRSVCFGSGDNIHSLTLSPDSGCHSPLATYDEDVERENCFPAGRAAVEFRGRRDWEGNNVSDKEGGNDCKGNSSQPVLDVIMMDRGSDLALRDGTGIGVLNL